MNSRPNIRVEYGKLVLRKTEEAEVVQENYLRQLMKGEPFVLKSPEAVLEEAKDYITQIGGDPFDDQLVASKSAIQFGPYRGRPFKWVLENDFGYSLMVLSKHQREGKAGKQDRSAIAASMDAFLQYSCRFKRVAKAIRERRQRDSKLPDCEGDCLVGFGVHKKSTYKELYEAKDRQRKSFVKYIRCQNTKTGSKMDALKQYILQKDQQKIRAEEKIKPSASQSVVQHPSHPASPAPTQSSHFKKTTAQDEAMEVEPQVLPPPPPRPIHSPRLERAQRQESAAPEFVLPKAWRSSLPKEQHEWIGRALFRQQGGRAVLTDELQMWWYPPQPRLPFHQPPASPDVFFTWPLCLWMPYKMWSYRLTCSSPKCRRSGFRLTSCGLYKTVRRVLNLHGWYFLATEYMECQGCHKKLAAWSRNILDQLHPFYRSKFPAILTYRFSCDLQVAKLMRERSRDNSATMLYHKLCELHSEDWMNRTLQYLSACQKFLSTITQPITPPPLMPPVPSAKWLLYVHADDILSRYDELKARVTTVYGSILNMESSKKAANKLSGAPAKTTASVTSVGNELGQVLMSVLTSHEGQGLQPMTTGLVKRYEGAGVAPPTLLYVDRDCCSSVASSRAAALFSSWDNLPVRLDVWHFMQRFAAGLHTDSHPLYKTFMAKLSACIFMWDEGDVARLKEMKRRELEQQQGVTDELLTSWITSRQLAQHCRCRTRGVEETERLIQEMLGDFKDARQTMGIPLVHHEKMAVIWSNQRHHLPCIQDPPGVQLYTQTGSVKKRGLTLPVYRCARGCTNLQSFHNHIDCFIPGKSANLENFQAFLLEGLERWNEERAAAAATHEAPSLRCYSGQLKHSLNLLSQEVLGLSLVTDYSKPRQYTGELIGVEYLCSQQCWEFRERFGQDKDTPEGDLDKLGEEEEEEFGSEDEEQDHTISPLTLMSTREALPLHPDIPSSSQSTQDMEPETQDVCRGPDGTPGYDRVVELTRYLIEVRENPHLSGSEAANIVRLWDRLLDCDKLTHEGRPRCIGQGSSQWPNSRIVEALCSDLSIFHPARKVKWGVTVSRLAAVLRDYQAIQRLLENTPTLKGKTRIEMPNINKKMLSVWYKNYCKSLE